MDEEGGKTGDGGTYRPLRPAGTGRREPLYDVVSSGPNSAPSRLVISVGKRPGADRIGIKVSRMTQCCYIGCVIEYVDDSPIALTKWMERYM